MRKTHCDTLDAAVSIAPLPGWVLAAPSERLADVAFRSGAALAHLHTVAVQVAVPQALWRERLALAAAEVCAGFSGRREGQAALRDALHLTRPGDHPSLAGAIFGQWSRAVARQISVANLGKVLPGLTAEQIAVNLDAAGSTAVVRAAAVLENRRTSEYALADVVHYMAGRMARLEAST